MMSAATVEKGPISSVPSTNANIMSGPFPDIEKLIASIARILAMQGSAREVAILATSAPVLEESSSDNWNGGTYGYRLVLSIPAQLYAQVFDICETLEESIKSRGREFFKARPNEYLEAVKIVPAIEA